ncbi:MAG: homoserine O-succinyltransferase [Selenomonadaceae bacterium]|nr:homoserine O-succinyltransferase [Selenomonadaceae bacterium]MBR3722708.1 homoserine O-succinyltransferase [Selenomonadaceae bacterium]
MPIKIPNQLPAAEVLEGENIFFMDADRAYSQDIRPLKLLILNLMPLKAVTETQLLRLLGNTPLQVEVDFIYTESYTPSHTPMDHLTEFYGTFHEVRHRKYDGFLVTGAPVEHLAFEDVAYAEELDEIFEWSKSNAYSTFHICWGAQAGLYYHYGVPKYYMEEKLSGVFPHRILTPHETLLRGFDDRFFVPHSRHSMNKKEDIEKVPELKILAEMESGEPYIIANLEARQFFITGHAEYDPLTLHNEYIRDIEAGLNPKIPENYYPDDDPTKKPIVCWRSVAHMLFANWLNYYVYQGTPYELDELFQDHREG